MARDMVPKRGGDYDQPGRAVLSYIERSRSVSPMTSSDWTRAVPILSKSLEWMPTNASSHYFIGLCLQKQLKFHDAVKYLRRSILLDPDFKLHYCVLGSCFLQLRLFEEAIEVGLVGL